MAPRFVAMVFLYLMGLMPLSVSAQGTPPLKMGDRVRISVGEGQPYSHSLEGPQIGSGRFVWVRVQSVAESVILVEGMAGEWTIPIRSIKEAQVSLGRNRNTLKGLGVGALIGGVSGVTLGFLMGDAPADCWLICPTAEEAALYGGGILGALGGVIGLVVGTLTKSDRWENLSLSGMKPSAQVARAGGLNLGFSIPLKR